MEGNNSWIDDVIKEHQKQLKSIVNSKSSAEITNMNLQSNNVIATPANIESNNLSNDKNFFFSDNDIQLSDYEPRKKSEQVLVNNSNQNLVQTSKSFSHNWNTLNSMHSKPNTSSVKTETIASQNMNNITNANTTNNTLDTCGYQWKLQKKKTKIKLLKEELQKLREQSQMNHQSENIKTVQENEDVRLWKDQICKYEESLNNTSRHYEAQIQALDNKWKQYTGYIDIIFGFLHSIRNNYFPTLVTQKENNKMLSPDEFGVTWSTLENYIGETMNESSNLKLKYHKLWDVNNKWINVDTPTEIPFYKEEKNTINTNRNTSEYNEELNTIHIFNDKPEVENVFAKNYCNNYEEVDVGYNQPKNSNYGNENSQNNSNNNSINNQYEIYKTWEQRINMWEQELSNQKNINLNASNRKREVRMHEIYNTVNVKNDTLTKLRSKSNNRGCSGSNIKTNCNYIDDSNNIPIWDKPKKTAKKKKLANPSNNSGKGSICSKISKKGEKHPTASTSNIRCITPIHSKKAWQSHNIPSKINNKNTKKKY